LKTILESLEQHQMYAKSFMDITRGMMMRCGGEDLAVFAIIAWRICHRRNGVLHGEKFIHPNHLVKEAEQYSRQFTGENASLPQSNLTMAPAKMVGTEFWKIQGELGYSTGWRT
jgi:hypothetical protein